jgi:hypothetical protein
VVVAAAEAIKETTETAKETAHWECLLGGMTRVTLAVLLIKVNTK